MRSVVEALQPAFAEYGTLSGFSPTAFHTTHCGRTFSSFGMFSASTESIFLFVAFGSFMYNLFTPSVAGGAAMTQPRQLPLILCTGVQRRRCRTCDRLS